jgi:RimJ/RimL family protein N-acetyltransferase
MSNSNEFIGYCGLVHMSQENSRAEISFLLNPKIKEGSVEYKSIFLEVLRMLCDHSFKKIYINKVYTETYEFRKEHISILEEFGFTKEGLLREHILVNKKYHNSIIHSILRKEYT